MISRRIIMFNLKTTALILLLFGLFAFTGCGNGSESSGSNNTGSGETVLPLPEDVISDTVVTSAVQSQMISFLNFNLTFLDAESLPVTPVLVKVSDSGGKVITVYISDSNGSASFVATLDASVTGIILVVEHPGYIAKTINIDNIKNISAVTRTIYLEKMAVPEAVIDSDSDGVPDNLDAFPNDPGLIAEVYGEFIIAFEDLYPNKGDADFNDLVVKIGITEYINPQNRISKINIRSKVLAAGAGYNNQFWIGILGTDYQLIVDSKGDIDGNYNSRKTSSGFDTYCYGPKHSYDITFTRPVDRSKIAPMPYDPYIICNGVDANQVHLPFVATTFAGARLDDDHFPWAILVPGTWKWPYENTSEYPNSIFIAYPNFKWFYSNGEQNTDWYNYPDDAYVYPVPDDAFNLF